jgi:hypothetical protein
MVNREIVVPVSNSWSVVSFSGTLVAAEVLQKIDTFCLHDASEIDGEHVPSVHGPDESNAG